MTLESDRKPTLIIVSGRPGSGKTILARTLAKALSCPLISRDEIYEGLFRTFAGPELADKDRITKSAFDAFFRVIEFLLSSDVTFVAEAAFQNERWRIGLEPLVPLAHMKLIHCTIDSELASQRVIRRRLQRQTVPGETRPPAELTVDSRAPVIRPFEPLSLPIPSLQVDTANGYAPKIEEIVAFIKAR